MTAPPPQPLTEAEPARPPGFLGKRGRVLSVITDGVHTMRAVAYSFVDGSDHIYLEAFEAHHGGTAPRLFALPTAVHALLNVGETEIFEMENRHEADGESDA